MNMDVLRHVMAGPQAGKLIFPEVVRRLLDAGVESYFCDLAARGETFYKSDGKTYSEKMTLPSAPIAAGRNSFLSPKLE